VEQDGGGLLADYRDLLSRAAGEAPTRWQGTRVKGRQPARLPTARTPGIDDMPSLTYERKGRRIGAERRETIYDLCPTYDEDRPRADKHCQSPPRYLNGVVAADYNADLNSTGSRGPEGTLSVTHPAPRQPRGPESAHSSGQSLAPASTTRGRATHV
jgi:hypothetical protein